MSKMVVVVFINICALLILSTMSPAAQAASTGDCSRVVKKKLFCENYLKKPATTTPPAISNSLREPTTPAISISPRTRSCCDTLSKIIYGRDDRVVKCLKQSPPLGSAAFPTSMPDRLLPARPLPDICYPIYQIHANLIAPETETETETTESHELQFLRPWFPESPKNIPKPPHKNHPGQKPPKTHPGHKQPPVDPWLRGLLPPFLLPTPPPPPPGLPAESPPTPQLPAHPPAAEAEAELVEEQIN